MCDIRWTVSFPTRDSGDGPQFQQITPPPSSPFVDPRVAFHDLFDKSNDDTAVPRRDNPNIAEDDDVLSSTLRNPDPAFKEAPLECPSQDYDFEEGAMEIAYSFGLESEADNDNILPEAQIPAFDMPDPLAAEPESLTPNVPCLDEGEEYTPKQFMAERKTAEGLQFLVQWQDYPEEKDWTWETEIAMIESAPDMVMAWLAKSEVEVEEENPITVDYIVEKILGRRKFKGLPYYLVKWKGYEEVKDRTWEPCERLRIDVPLIVEAFELKKRKK